jgi:cytochrome b subunit of formate dehydrogenase
MRSVRSLFIGMMVWACCLLPAVASAAAAKLDNTTCLTCHGASSDKIEVPAEDGKKRTLLAFDDRYAQSVHGKMECVACHKEIVDDTTPHKKADVPRPNCAECHKALWASAQAANEAKQRPRLKVIVDNIEAYQKSFHAEPTKAKPNQPKASCEDCHNSHFFNVPPAGSEARKGPWRLETPNVCGEKCHSDSLDDYRESVHGELVTAKKDVKGAVCIDCHTSHAVMTTAGDPFRLQITSQCGSCHKENFGSYADTYHGKVNQLGYSYTAQCHDCHGSHGIVKASDPNSKVHPDNKLGTCRQCHDGKKLKEATAGFVSFAPHAHTGDFKRYPQMWVTGRFMIALLAGVFAFFWLHSALWFYREHKERTLRMARPHVQVEALPVEHGKQVRRFGPVWRLAHLLFAISVMLLVLTGMTVFYAESAWAPVVVRALGGPQVAGIIHRTAAAVMLGIFFIHLVYMALHLWRIRKTFKWFGPDSLVPNWKDLQDIAGMFKWGLGRGPKPLFDRWTFWEKFDYWAVFWGMGIIGGSGLLLAFPTETAAVLPGWVLNVAALVHGEEAFLAAVFLFTVHFFNNHFRPEKLPPPDVVMFTGSVELEEFRREHPLHYKRLKESGELAKHLVDAPSRPMTAGSRLLGLLLLAAGLTLLTLVVIGFFSG